MTQTTIGKRRISNPEVLNEAYDYEKPSAFSRGIRVDLSEASILYISGTAAIDEYGETLHVGDFSKQLRRTLDNIAGLLSSEGGQWKDVVRTTCYLRDIDRDYAAFNIERTRYFKEAGISTFPASTCVEARLCRPDLLVEIEAIAMIPFNRVFCEAPIS